jgi:hypothetical protein
MRQMTSVRYFRAPWYALRFISGGLGAILMRRFASILSTLSAVAACGLSAGAFAFTRDVGNIAVIEDTTGTIHDTEGFWGPDQLCREAARIFFQTHCDEYDALITFDAKPVVGFEDMIRNVQQGTPTKNEVDGIGYPRFNWNASYGGVQRLEQCVSMAGLGTIPDQPDGPATAFFGLPLGITGIELLGHEFGHRYLLGVEYDKNDGRGRQTLLRGSESGGGGGGGEPQEASANLHYNYYTDSHSVMYGNFITDNGDGTFRACGGVRGYNPLDQYLMGLRAAADVPPILALDDGSGQGSAAVPIPNGTCNTISGSNFSRVDITIEDIVRAMGPRLPAAASRTWRMAFILVTEQGRDATTQQVNKVDAYRTRWEQWFPGATDQRGAVNTTLGPATCIRDGGVTPPRDGGLKPPEDAGVRDGGGATVDAGSTAPDAGSTESSDGGANDGGADDAGTPASSDGGGSSGGRDGGGTVIYQRSPGCGCEAQRGAPVSGVVLLFAAGWLLVVRRRRGPFAK